MPKKSKKENDMINIVEDIIPVDYSEEMKQSYIDYSMSVITDRALPDARDGLKPVHRRILYAMNEAGMTQNKAYNKCAEIVGNVLGGYHPHGDSSVYGALVRMAQNFSLRHTLIDGHGNFGSIDGDGAAHMRYCVTGDTLVNTDKGLIKIKELVSKSRLNSEQDIDINIMSLNNTINHSNKFFNSGIHPIKEVVTEFGYSIKGSYNHPLIALTTDKDGKSSLSWKSLEELKIGDLLLISNSSEIGSSIDMVTKEEVQCMSLDFNFDEVPSVILKSSSTIQAEFLKMLFNGTVSTYKENDDKFMFYGNKNLPLIKQIQIMLLQFGICSVVASENEFHFIMVYSDALRFLDHNDKASGYSYFYLPIKEINHLPPEPVYCIRVESDCHSFMANGFMNHNTEARLQGLSNELLENLKYNTVKMVPNFNEKKSEPVILPAMFPNLLVNGATGIAVGMMTSIPTHNLGESIDAIILALDKPNSTTSDLLEILKGPDFPTGGIVTNKKDLLKIYEDGSGSITVRGKYNLESSNNKNSIVITEIPYTMSGKKESFVEAVIQLAQTKKELQIVAVRDETSKEGIRIVIEVKKDINIDTVINYLCKFTGFEDTFKFSFLCLHDGKPVLMSLKQYIGVFIEHQKEVYTKKFAFLRDKNKIQIEKLNGFLIAYDFIDEIISIVRKAESIADMRTALRTGNTDKIPGLTAKDRKTISKFSFTDIQSDVILETKLYELSKLKIGEIVNTISKLEKENMVYDGLLSSNSKMKNHIKKSLLELKAVYGDKRRTQIISAETKFVPIVENYEIIVDENNYAKKVKTDSGNAMLESDKLCAIVENGASYLIPYKSIPIGNAKDKGVALENFTEGNPVLFSFIPKEDKKLLLIDSEGYGKIVEQSEFICSRKFLKGYLDKSKLIFVRELEKETEIILKNPVGKEKKFKISELQPLGRTAKGRKVVTGKFEVVSAEIK